MSLGVLVERYGPYGIALTCSALFLWQGGSLFSFAKANHWNVPAVYASVFDLSSIIAAFVFGFFTFARTSETEFLRRMRETVTYKRFMGYLIEAMVAAAIVVVASIPFMIAEPQPELLSEPWYWLCTAWVALVAFALSATVRSMRQFVEMAMVE